MNITKLKGGSLSGTYIHDDGTHKWVRKHVSLDNNREYGFVRWYSQLKKMMRFSKLFPGVFINVTDFGVSDDGHDAYYDMPYIENSEDLYSYIDGLESTSAVQDVFNKVLACMEELHSVQMEFCKSSLQLYFVEEVEKKLSDAFQSLEFKEFASLEYVEFQGKRVKSLLSVFDLYQSEFKNIETEKLREVFTHGNITLENILYDKSNSKVIFIDPYEENIVDLVHAEYSQLLQSANGMYETLNDCAVERTSSSVKTTSEIKASFGMAEFNRLLHNHLQGNFTKNEMKLIKLLEISQFIRMLPFKLVVDKNKMFLFYGLASYLFSEYCKNYNLSSKRLVL